MTDVAGHRDIIAVGASAGGVEALRALTAGLPADLNAAVLIVLHIPRYAPSVLPRILDRVCPLPVRPAVDGEHLRRGTVYTASPDLHLLVADHRIRLSRGPTENGHRPAVDPLFRAVAQFLGPRAVGVVLSGSRDDGAAGMAAIAARGGMTVVQDPEEALYPSMPTAAMASTNVHHVLPAEKIGALLGGLTREPITLEHLPYDDPALSAEVLMAQKLMTMDTIGDPAGYGCPSCGGALYALGEWPTKRYRCRVGHAWTAEALIDEQSSALEEALWMALRALEEKASLGRQMADGREARGDERGRVRYSTLAEQAATAAGTLRDLIDRLGAAAAEPRT